MAIIKHHTSKNARYSDVLEYYSYKHQEDSRTGHYEPILDEYGLLKERDNYATAYITAYRVVGNGPNRKSTFNGSESGD